MIKQILLQGSEFAEAFGLAELYFNRKLSLVGQTRQAALFLGDFYEDTTSGTALSLVFKFEGENSLQDLMQASDFPFNVEDALFRKGGSDGDLIRKARIIRRISSQLFSNLAGIHSWNIVHRDIKGANLILSTDDKRFKLIDFGVACDVVSRINYDSAVQPFDPSFCPPEAVPEMGGIVLGAGGKFDVFSAALVVLQMCFPELRSDRSISQFKVKLAKCGYDLNKWRRIYAEPQPRNAEGIQILDEYDGWSLLEACLKQNPGQRISAATAGRSRFCRV